MAINKDYNNYYEKIGNEYNNIRLDTKNDRENVIKIIKKYANSKHKKILDIGCGTGKYGEMMQENGYKAFKEVHRVLKTNGILIIKTCSHEDLKYRFTAKFFPKTFEIDKTRYPDITELRNELSIFSKIEIENASIIVEKSKEKYLNQYKKRGTSNFSFLTEEEINEGIKKFEETYKGQDMIQKITKNTFVIARKD